MSARDNWAASPSLLLPTRGRYTPTSTAGTNVASTTANECLFYLIDNDILHVAGSVSIDPTAGSTQTDLTLTLPPGFAIANFAATTDARGGAVRGGVATPNISAPVIGVIGARTVQLIYLNDTDTANRTWTFWLDCKVRT